MSARKKPWVNSMFSQLAHEDNSPKRKKWNRDLKPTNDCTKKLKIIPSEEIIDVESQHQSGNSFAEFQTSTFWKKTEIDAQISTENWITFFAPRSIDELAIHPKKLQELDQWFQHCGAMKLKRPAQLCLLSGPSGSGKTTAVRILAKENNFSIQEWINPLDQDVVYNLGDQMPGQTFVGSQVDSFKNFLFQASRYRSLFDNSLTNKCLLIVEDFPNFLLRDPTALENILDEYVNYAKSPIIFIVTDAKTQSLNISYNIFTDEIKKKFLFNHISFNSIASTIMQKSVKRFCTLMRSPTQSQLYKPPPPDIVDSIIISAQGDIRSALINLHFCSLRGAPNILITRMEKTKNSSRRKKKDESKLKSIGRNESVTMMHALGRVFNPKFTENKHFLHCPEDLAEAFTTEPKKFIDLVQANYLAHFSDIEHVLKAAKGLSLCDVILKEYRDNSLALEGLNVGIRSVMVANSKPVTGWLPIKGQRIINTNSGRNLAQKSKNLPKNHNISCRLYTLDYQTFVNVISP